MLFCSLFLWLGKIDNISHYCPQSSQIFSYINIFNINRKLLIQACSIIAKCPRARHVGINFTYLIVILFQWIVNIHFCQLIFVCIEYLVQTCSRAIVELINTFGIAKRSYFNILYTFLVRCKIYLLFFWLGKIDRVSHFCPMSTQIYKCTNILDISWKSLSRALTWIHNILFLLNTAKR